MDEPAMTPTADHLFQTNPSPVFLSPDQTELFHHNVTKLLFLCKWACPDIQMAMVY